MIASAARAGVEELGRCAGVLNLFFDFGVSKGFIGIPSLWSPSSNGSQSRSPGRRDSVELLFFIDRVGGRSSVKRASSICRRAI
jgi:hypothetical protein